MRRKALVKANDGGRKQRAKNGTKQTTAQLTQVDSEVTECRLA